MDLDTIGTVLFMAGVILIIPELERVRPRAKLWVLIGTGLLVLHIALEVYFSDPVVRDMSYEAASKGDLLSLFGGFLCFASGVLTRTSRRSKSDV